MLVAYYSVGIALVGLIEVAMILATWGPPNWNRIEGRKRSSAGERFGHLDALVAGVGDPRRHRIDLEAPVRERVHELERPVEVDVG